MGERKGWYAGIEAIDGAGKTTQIGLAKEFAEKKGIDAIFVREPGGSDLGVVIREILLTNKDIKLTPEEEFMLFTADRSYLINNTILPALEKDQVVITDRRIESTVYQSSGGGMSLETTRHLSSLFLPERYMRPDGLAILSISKETRRKRNLIKINDGIADKIEKRDDSFADRVHDAYAELEKLDYVSVVDGERDQEDVFKDLKPILFGPYAK